MTYKEFIQNIINTRGQWNIPKEEYWEGHHIVPKCLGGKGRPKCKDANIIWLYPQEHYEAHRLLALENPKNSSLLWAWYVISHCSNSENHKIKINAEEYAALRLKIAKDASKKFKGQIPWNKGKHNVYTEETLQSISTNKLGQSPWNKGLKLKEETKLKIKAARAKQKDPRIGKKHSEKTKNYLSNYFKKKPSHSTSIKDLLTNKEYISMQACCDDIQIKFGMLQLCIKTGKSWKNHTFKIIKQDVTKK